MITTIAIALLNPMQVAENTVVPNVPEPTEKTYNWTTQKSHGKGFLGSWTQTGTQFNNPEDWNSDM